MTDERSPKLTSEQLEAVLSEVKRSMEEGYLSPKLEPSLLGLDWDCFSTQEFSESATRQEWRNPPEFVPIGFSILDAYTAAILSSGFEFEPEELVSFRCRLTRFMLDGPTRIELRMKADRWPLATYDHHNEIHTAFRDLLGARGFDEARTQFLWQEGPGCPLSVSYPGNLVSQKSPLLRDRPVEEWPRASLTIPVTNELRSRARDVLAFLRSSPGADAVAN
jgi:hypothetical protein